MGKPLTIHLHDVSRRFCEVTTTMDRNSIWKLVTSRLAVIASGAGTVLSPSATSWERIHHGAASPCVWQLQASPASTL